MNIEILTQTLNALKRPMPAEAIAKLCGVSAEEALEGIRALIQEGRCVETHSHKYAPIQMMSLVLCKARCMPGAPSFARPIDGGEDYYLDMPDETALDGDLILIRKTQGERPRGTLIRVVKRAHLCVSGSVFVDLPEPESRRRPNRRSRFRYSKPLEPEKLAIVADRRLPARIPIEGDLMGAKAGDLCLFEVSKWPYHGSGMRVRVSQVVGQTGDIGAQLRALLAQYGIETAFSDDALRMASLLPDSPSESDMVGRLDLRSKTIFTIDGADAQDFDDAVSLEENDGKTVLGVHIADVSYYVAPDSPIDADARQRGTSVYLPGMTVPMLPEALCNGLCSLKPNVNRLTFSLLMTLKDEKVVSFDLRPAVICSRARLTYDDVNALLEGRENTVPAELRETLSRMNALAKRLKARRMARGALELDLAEPEFDLDDTGMPVAARARTRGDAHELIEEFMLIANETVASHAQHTELPFPYRVHEAPDSEKLSSLETFLAQLGRPQKLGSKPTPLKLQTVLRAFENRPESVVVARTLLRSMSRAHYSEKPLGHYGLAARDYCHFTSPIRRYPDLLAHRVLRMQLEGKIDAVAQNRLSGRMHEWTNEASDCEQRAADCERDGDGVMCAAYLSRHIGERFSGTVTHLSRRGAVVLLENTAEGRVPPQLMDDFYSLDDDRLMMVGRHSRRVIRLGDRINVEVYSANIPSGEIEFAMV